MYLTPINTLLLLSVRTIIFQVFRVKYSQSSLLDLLEDNTINWAPMTNIRVLCVPCSIPYAVPHVIHYNIGPDCVLVYYSTARAWQVESVQASSYLSSAVSRNRNAVSSVSCVYCTQSCPIILGGFTIAFTFLLGEVALRI